MFTRRQFGRHTTAMVTALAVKPMSAFAAEKTLRFGCISAAASDSYRVDLEPFARAVEAASDDRLEIALKPVGGYGPTGDLLPMIERGDLEIMAGVQGYYPGRFPRSSVIELPMLFNDAPTGTKALNTLFHEGLLDKDYASLKVLAIYTTTPYSIFTTGKKISATRDLRGLRIRTPSPTIGIPLARLGAIPLGTPANLIGEAIDNKMIDAIAYSMDATLSSLAADGSKLADKLKVVIDLHFAAPALMLVMNRAAWDSLPVDVQAAMEKQAAIMTTEGAKHRENAHQAALAIFRADPRYTLITPTAELRAEFEKAMTPSFDDWKAAMGRQGIDGEHLLARTRELVKQSKLATN